MVINKSIFTASPETSLFHVTDQRTYYWHKRNPANWPDPPREAGPILILPWLLTCCVAFVSSSNDNIYLTGMLWSSTNPKNCSSSRLKDQYRIYYKARELKTLCRGLICPLSWWGRLVAGVLCSLCTLTNVPFTIQTHRILSNWMETENWCTKQTLCHFTLLFVCLIPLWVRGGDALHWPWSFPGLHFGFSPFSQYFISLTSCQHLVLIMISFSKTCLWYYTSRILPLWLTIHGPSHLLFI